MKFQLIIIYNFYKIFSETRIGKRRCLSSCENKWYFHMMIFLYFPKFYSRSFKAGNELNFYKIRKKTSVQGLNFSPNSHCPQLALPPTGTFLNFFLCHWEFESPNCRYTKIYIKITLMKTEWSIKYIFQSLIINSLRVYLNKSNRKLKIKIVFKESVCV